MHTAKMLRILFTVWLVLLWCASGATAQRKKQVAVLNFDFVTRDLGIASHTYGGQENLGRQIADKLMTGLFGLGSCHVIERSQLERILHEQNLGQAGRIDDATAAKIGRILGVDLLVIGHVSALELVDGPKDNRDIYWNPKNLKARIAVNVRLVNTTTARLEFIRELVGVSAPPQEKKSTKGEAVGGFISGILSGSSNRSSQTVKVSDEQIRDVVYRSVDSVVTKITADMDSYFTGPGPAAEAAPPAEKLINGRVIAVNGPSVVIADIARSAVRMGDRLYVRRGVVKRDKVTGKEFRYSEKVGEVEVVEIQDEVIVGSFSGSLKVQEGDTVTNSASGSGIPAAAPTPQQDAPSRSAPPPTPPADARSKIVMLPANQAWLDTGIEVRPGMTFQISVEGMIGIDRVNKVNANGMANRSRVTGLPMPSAQLGALLVKIRYANGKDSNLVLIGTNGSATADPGEFGRLLLGLNDNTLADNSGAFRVTLRW